ncbi:MAG: amidohydrolase family protein [Parafilimonas sp.]
MLDENNVLIADESGVVKDIVHQKDAGGDIEIFEGLLSPGFINCHCHLELSHMKNVVENGTGLVEFLIKVVGKRSAVKEEIEAAMQAADEEMYNNGIVAVGDICNTTDSISIKQKSKIQYHNFIEVLGFTEEKAKARLTPYLYVYKEFCEAGFAEHTSIVPHAPYTISKTMFQLINEASAGKIISIHNQECLAEDELYRTATGDFFKLYYHLDINTDFFLPYKTSSIQSYLPLLNNAKKLILVHNTFTKQPDLDFAFDQAAKSNQQIYWCLCANANLYIENKLPPVELFKQNYCDIVLGTDSYSSNWSLNILDEIKTLQKNFPLLQLKEMLKWATLNGAKALGINYISGSFENGKQPGIVIIDNLVNKKISNISEVKRLV